MALRKLLGLASVLRSKRVALEENGARGVEHADEHGLGV